jgi:hypothetical protein
MNAQQDLLNKKRFIGNGKNTPIVVIGVNKFYRYTQKIVDKKTGEVKTIKHIRE